MKPGAIQGTRDLLAWLGLSWDAEAPLQSTDLTPYRDAMRALAARGLVYPCARTRGDIARAQSAPNEGDEAGSGDDPMPSEDRFGTELRPEGFRRGIPRTFDDEATNWRFAVESGNPTRFEDRIAGPQSHDIETTTGDFLVWTKRGQPSYQLAVVVDDARQGVTKIVRGDDLLPSAARQLVLWRALADDLGWGAFPEQWHLPLVRGTDGRRLAKRHGDTRLDRYRDAGVPAERVIGLVAFWSGVSGLGERSGLSGKTDSREAMSAADFFAGFDPDRMSRSDVVFTEADDRWLTTP